MTETVVAPRLENRNKSPKYWVVVGGKINGEWQYVRLKDFPTIAECVEFGQKIGHKYPAPDAGWGITDNDGNFIPPQRWDLN